MITVAFDVYGTLIDTQAVVTALRNLVGEAAQEFSKTWREKQLEYSFRRGLMNKYEPFSVCTSDALDYACLFYGFDLTINQRRDLLECYSSLPAYNDVQGALQTLAGGRCRLFAFSNGTADAVNQLLVSAGIRDYFEGVVSVDSVRSFKPNPAVYTHFLQAADAETASAWLVSSNPFDVIGAISSGMRAAWVRRSDSAIFDPWGYEPTVTIKSLNELHEKLVDQ